MVERDFETLIDVSSLSGLLDRVRELTAADGNSVTGLGGSPDEELRE